MNKTAIKNFAIWARNKLIADISYRAGLMGITPDGINPALPQSTGQMKFYDIGTAEPYVISGEAIRQREHLAELIRRKAKDSDYKTAYKYIIEEVAYTWFNRLIAVRFMEVNDYLPSHIRVLSSGQGKIEPDLVTTPFDADLDFSRDEQQAIIDLRSENKLDDVFRILFIKQCNALNEILPALFEKTNDYTELLLNLSVVDQDGVVYHLVHDISEEDFDVERGGQVEIIGWLYQYYNTEPKDETFALLKKNIKISKERIPSATQLFTPDWIVRYMVENSLGRLWIEHLIACGDTRTEAEIAADFGWKYYLPEAEQEPEVTEQFKKIRGERKDLTPEAIRCIDPCMGSGHICVYLFSVLMQIYESAGYGQREAAKSILENNLYGLDIDDRAFQMAYFAVMMKAREYNRRILNGENRPKLYSIQESNGIDREQLKFFGMGMDKAEREAALQDMTELLDTFVDAKEYGSILTVKMYDWRRIKRFATAFENEGQISLESIGLEDTSAVLIKIIEQGICLAQKYDVTSTNPPYMGQGGMSTILSRFVKEKYPSMKTDMYSVFVQRCSELTRADGYYAMITPPAILFLTSFDKLRKKIIHFNTIINVLHMGRGIFGIDFGSCAFVVFNGKINDYHGQYYKLHERTFQYIEPYDIEELFLSAKNNKGVYCRFSNYRTDEGIKRVISNTDNNTLYIRRQESFLSIPGNPFSYSISDNVFKAFSGKKTVDTSISKCGMGTSDNNRFLRLWSEVPYYRIGFNYADIKETEDKKYRWIPYDKGGDYRKWYGNQSYVVNFYNNGEDIREATKDATGGRVVGTDYYFKRHISWSDICSYKLSFRFFPNGFIFDASANAVFLESDSELISMLGYLNTTIVNEWAKILNPTVHFKIGNYQALPHFGAVSDKINKYVIENIAMAKDDWDSRETSWEFKGHPLVVVSKGLKGITLKENFKKWKAITETRLIDTKSNEVLINEYYISYFEIEGEISSSVDDKDITLSMADEFVDVRSLLSYAVGCMFGRYSLDVEGLAYAGGEWDSNKYTTFIPDTDNVIPITDEEYLEDDIVARLCEWLKVVYGKETLEENLDFIAKALGNKGSSSREIIRNYFLTDFFKDHCQTYSVTGSGKRPIYWLFDSGKQNGFKALIYLHRYNADTIGNLRIDYLHRMQRIYESEIVRMQDMIDNSTNNREVAQATKRRERLTKQLKECREYDEKLAHLALSRIELDLDDGVKVNYRKLQTANDGKFYEVLADSKNIMAKK